MLQLLRKLKTMIGRKTLIGAALAAALFVGFLLIYFPGRQAPLALTLSTGWNMPQLQARIDALEDQAIRGDALDPIDQRFLTRLYTTGRKIGALTRMAPQTSRLLKRWLDATGEELQVPGQLFRTSRRVQDRMDTLRKKIARDAANPGGMQAQYRTEVFYMGDPITLDTVAALYFGTLTAWPQHHDNGTTTLRWRAEFLWKWPTYDELFRKYGDPHAQNFKVPNLKSFLRGPRHALHIDDGLGGHLETLGLAKPFDVWAEWRDPTPAR